MRYGSSSGNQVSGSTPTEARVADQPNRATRSSEAEIIIPAIEQANKDNILTFGPYPADGFFGSDGHRKFDAILAMYHDQGLAPFKALAFDSGVNYTGGLSIIRTSPAHGTAFELAGKNEATENSFRQAIYLAVDAYINRMNHEELTSNSLKPQKAPFDKSGKNNHS